MQDCEADLRELSLQKHKILESIIAEKTMNMQELESELSKEKSDNKKLEEGLKEKQAVLESYEKRFLNIRSLIEK